MEDVIFWELGGYKRVLDELRKGQGSCELFVKMIQERAEIEERYSRSLDSWRERWSDHSIHGREVGSTIIAWNTCLQEASMVAEIHRDCSHRLSRDGGPAENMTGWLGEHFRQKDNNGQDLIQRTENEFEAASEEFKKAYERTLRVREAYHKLSEDAQKARRFADDERQEKFVNKSTKNRLFNRADKLTIQENYVRRVYKRRVDTCQGDVKDRYIEGMERVLERCRGIETARLQCLKNQILTFITMVDMSGASTTLLEGSRTAYNDVTKANPDMDVQEWVLSFNLNTFIELPSFEEFITGSEEYETVQESQIPQKPSGSFFQLSLFGSSSDQDDSSDSESESSSSSDSSSTSGSESDSSAATRVSSLSNVSRKSKKTATNGRPAIQPREQNNSRPDSNVAHQQSRQQSNNHIGNADISVQRQTSGQWDRVTEPSARTSTTQSNSSQLSVNQSTPKVSTRADETTNACQCDITTKSDIQTTYAHTSKSTGFSIDNNTVDMNETSQTSAIVHNRDTNQLQDTSQNHNPTFGKVDAPSQNIDNVTTDTFSNAITSVEREPSAHDRIQNEYRDNEQPSIDEKPITDESSVIGSSYANLSELRKENDFKSKGMQTHEPGGVETQKGCLDNSGVTVVEQDITPVKNTKDSSSSFYKNTQWSPVCPPLTCDKNEQNAVNSSESKERRQVKDGDVRIRQSIDVNTTNYHHENLCHFSQEPNHQGRSNNGVNPPTGDIDRRHDLHGSGHTVCCLLKDDDMCAYRAPQTMFSPDKCLARWFLGRYPEYEQMGENMWRRLQKTNPTRYKAALMDAKKLMLFVDTRSSNHSPNIADVDICNSLHICRRQFDQRHHCGCVYEGLDQEKKGQNALHKKNHQVSQAEDKLCQEVTSRLLRSHQSLHDTKQPSDECGLQGSSEHMCRVATGLILGKNIHDESERLDSRRCECREPLKIQDEKQKKDWNVRGCNCHQRRDDFTGETCQDEDRTLDSSDESDFSTDVSPSDADNTRVTIHVDDRHKADNDARETLKPTDGEFLVKALYKFSPANWDELKLRTGEYLIQIGQDSDNGWAMGRTKTKQGLFPASYVKFVKK